MTLEGATTDLFSVFDFRPPPRCPFSCCCCGFFFFFWGVFVLVRLCCFLLVFCLSVRLSLCLAVSLCCVVVCLLLWGGVFWVGVVVVCCCCCCCCCCFLLLCRCCWFCACVALKPGLASKFLPSFVRVHACVCVFSVESILCSVVFTYVLPRGRPQ